jgi:hypothetical protein
MAGLEIARAARLIEKGDRIFVYTNSTETRLVHAVRVCQSGNVTIRFRDPDGRADFIKVHGDYPLIMLVD